MPLGAQPLMLIVNPDDDRFGERDAIPRDELAGARLIVSHRGSLMRSLVDEMLSDGIAIEIAVEVAHRTSILPLVLRGIGHAVMPASWAAIAAHSGLKAIRLEPESLLHISVISRAEHLSAAASAFLDVAAEFALPANR